MEKITIGGLVHLKSSFEAWEKLFLNDEDNKEQVEKGNIFYGKASDKTALIVMKEVDPEMMKKRMSDPKFEEMTKDYVVSHEIYGMAPMN